MNIKSNFAAQPEIDRLFPQVRLSSVSSSLLRDTRNDPVEPSAGTLIGGDAELAARRIGSQVGFFKTFVQGFTYRRLPRPTATVLAWAPASASRPGFQERSHATVRPSSSTTYRRASGSTPAATRRFAGSRSIGSARPTRSTRTGSRRGGHGLIVLNAELRIPVRGGLGAVTFIDGGNVFSTVDEMAFSRSCAVRSASALRYRSPVGPIRVDLGFKLDRQTLANGTAGTANGAAHILGQAF